MDLKSRKINIYKALLILLVIFFFLVYTYTFQNRNPNSTTIGVGSSTIYAQLANTDHKRSMGLSYTKEIDQNAGMLFVFDEVGKKHFWMRDMYFDLDIIWLDENKQVVGFFENVTKGSYNKDRPELSKIYHSPENTKYVLEVNAGTIKRLNIKTGDTLDFRI